MTEAEWLASDEPTELYFHVCRRLSERKIRLAAVACSRASWHRVTDWRCRRVVEVAEAFADGDATAAELVAAGNQILAERDIGMAGVVHQLVKLYTVWAMHESINAIRRLTSHDQATRGYALTRLPREAAAFRCLFGNPFRPVALDSAWRTSTVLALANGIYADRAFDRTPILADALQDAGCEDETVLTHLRHDETHVRGCWVVDMVLGKW